MKFSDFVLWAQAQPRSYLDTIFLGGFLLGLFAGCMFGWPVMLGVFIMLAVYKVLVLDKKAKGG